MGGDGFYGGLSVVYHEPVVQDGTYLARIPGGEAMGLNHEGTCPVAEEVQSRMMQFKTNYRDLDEAARQAGILKEAIELFEKHN